MKSLYLAWQGPDRKWFPVGRLDADAAHDRYFFGYTKGALTAEKAVGFKPLPAFPDFCAKYESSELFPLFKNRVLDANRKNFGEYLESLGLEHNDPIEILAVTGGERRTDNLEVFPKIVKDASGAFACRFFLHGLRHMSLEARTRAMTLKAGEQLGVSVELTNPATRVGIQLTTLPEYYFVGWTPNYLVGDLLKATADVALLSAKVVRVNMDDVPMNRRVLIEFSGRLPEQVTPMSDSQFQLITPKTLVA
jgi:hypothetical protein